MEAVPSESVQLVSVPQRASLARESVRLSTHLTWLFDVKTQLPHRGNKLRLVFVDLHISEYVVYETGESRGSLGADDADASDEGIVHGTLDEAEDMLHAASGLGLLAVILLLPVCQRMVTMPFLADDGYHARQSLYCEFLLKEILIHRSPIYRRFLHDYVVWYCKDTKLYQIVVRNN